MTTHYPADACAKPYPIAETVRERLMNVMLRKALPYLVKVEMSPSTHADLRDLIRQIEEVTND